MIGSSARIQFLNLFFGDINIFEILLIIIFMAVGIACGFLLSIYLRPSNRVFYLRERDGRGVELKIQNENARSLETRSRPELRFFKWGRAYEFLGRFRKKITTFFAKEGTAYSWCLTGFHMVKKMVEDPETKVKKVEMRKVEKLFVWTDEETGEEMREIREVDEPIMIPEKFELDMGSMEDVLKYRWGEEFYATVPDAQKELCQDNNLLVTVELEPGLTPEGYQPITEADINTQGDEDILQLYATSAKKALRGGAMDLLVGMGAGGFVTLMILLFFGYISVPG